MRLRWDDLQLFLAVHEEGSWETADYEAHRLIVRRVAPHVAMMASGDEHLFTSYGQKIPNTCRHSVCSIGLRVGCLGRVDRSPLLPTLGWRRWPSTGWF